MSLTRTGGDRGAEMEVLRQELKSRSWKKHHEKGPSPFFSSSTYKILKIAFAQTVIFYHALFVVTFTSPRRRSVENKYSGYI